MKSWLKRRPRPEAPDADDGNGDLRAAYERGRRDERARRRKNPVFGLVIAGAALVGGAALALAAMQGSFRDGGAVMDHQIATAASQAGPALRHVTGEASEAIRGRDSDGSPEAAAVDG